MNAHICKKWTFIMLNCRLNFTGAAPKKDQRKDHIQRSLAELTPTVQANRKELMKFKKDKSKLHFQFNTENSFSLKCATENPPKTLSVCV